jgi:hypothetical protein
MLREPLILFDSPRIMGRTAFTIGKELSDNPWPLMSREHADWNDGWLDALAQDSQSRPK